MKKPVKETHKEVVDSAKKSQSDATAVEYELNPLLQNALDKELDLLTTKVIYFTLFFYLICINVYQHEHKR